MNKKFLLISYVRDDLRTPGICYIFSYLKSRGIDVKVLYINVNEPINQKLLQQYFAENHFDVIGIGLTTTEYYYTVKLNSILKALCSSAFIFWGGYTPLVCRKNVLTM